MLRTRTTLARLTVSVLAALGVLSGAGLPALASTAPAADVPRPAQRATFGIQPAGTRGPDSRPYLIYPAAAGARLQDHVAVVNYSKQPLRLKVYATDALNGPDGSFSLLPGAQSPRDAGTWLRLTGADPQGFVTVRPTSYVLLGVRLAVPRGATPGDHVAGIVAALSTSTRNAKGTNVQLDQRVGIRTFVRVAGALRPRLSVTGLRASYEQVLDPRGLSRTTVTYTVRNTGNVALGGSQRVEVKGVVGPRFRSLPLKDLPLLVPGGTVRVTAVVPRTWPLVWMTERVTLVPKVVTGVSSGDVRPTTVTGHFLAIPWVLLGLVLVVLALVAGWRRRRKPPAARLAVVAAPTGPRSPSERGAPLTGGLRAASVAVLVAPLVLLGLATATPAAATEGVPYVDPAVTGSIGLCDVHGHNVLTGTITDNPFIWLAVGTTAAPGQYAAPGRTAFLAAYQPRKGVEPGEWSGYPLAPSSSYSNPQHPMAQSTPVSGSLQQFLVRYPPQWDGLVQLRLTLAGSNRPPRQSAYDATDIRVTGDTWQVVRGGTGPCRAGTATSESVLLHLPGAQGTPKPGAVASRPPLLRSPAPVLTGAAAKRAAAAGSSAATTTDRAVDRSPSGVAGASAAGLVVGGLGGAAIAALATGYALRRRRSP
ncbi:MAG: hypothetical protein ACXVWU_01940 [Nocardioides sp.]